MLFIPQYIIDELSLERFHQIHTGQTNEYNRKKGSYHLVAEAQNKLSSLVFRVDRATLAPERQELIEVITSLCAAVETIDIHETRRSEKN